MKIETIAIKFVDVDKGIKTFTKYYIYSSNQPFDFWTFKSDLEKLHEENKGILPFEDEIDVIAKRHGLNDSDVKEYEYKY